MIKKIAHILFFAITSLCYAQEYIPIDTVNTEKRESFVVKYKLISEKNNKDIRVKYSGKTGRELAKIYK